MARKAAGGTKALVAACIRRYPGIHLRGIERELGLSSGLVHYHVKALEAAGEALGASVGGCRRLFPKDAGGGRVLAPEDLDLLAALREEVAFHLVLLLLDGGPTPQADLVEETGLAKSTVSYHLERLVARGLLERVERPSGERVVRVRESARVRRLLLAYEPTADLQERFRGLWSDFYRG